MFERNTRLVYINNSNKGIFIVPERKWIIPKIPHDSEIISDWIYINNFNLYPKTEWHLSLLIHIHLSPSMETIFNLSPKLTFIFYIKSIFKTYLLGVFFGTMWNIKLNYNIANILLMTCFEVIVNLVSLQCSFSEVFVHTMKAVRLIYSERLNNLPCCLLITLSVC